MSSYPVGHHCPIGRPGVISGVNTIATGKDRALGREAIRLLRRNARVYSQWDYDRNTRAMNAMVPRYPGGFFTIEARSRYPTIQSPAAQVVVLDHTYRFNSQPSLPAITINMDVFSTLSSFFPNTPVLKEASEDDEIESSLPPREEETNSRGSYGNPAFCIIA